MVKRLWKEHLGFSTLLSITSFYCPTHFQGVLFTVMSGTRFARSPTWHVQIRVSQLRRDLQQCGLQNCHQETRPYRKEVRKESSQVSLVRPSGLFAFQHAWEHASMFFVCRIVFHTRCFHMFPTVPTCSNIFASKVKWRSWI